MKKRILSLLLTFAMLIGLVVSVPLQVSATGVIAPDTSWYVGHESDTEYTLYTAAEVLGFVKLGHEGNTFKEKTIKLGADIDLNPGWDATVTVKRGFATYPTVPANQWDMILQFSGILDGQGHILRGIYVSANLTNSGNDPDMICAMFGNISGNGDTLFGNVTITSGFTPGVRNLMILNSSTIATADAGASNRRVAGLAAYLTGGCIENFYTEMNTILKVQGTEWENIAGIVFGIRHPSATVANSTISNVVYNGIVGVANGTTIPGGATANTNTAKIATAACNVSYENCLTVGAAYYLGNKYGNCFANYYNGNQDASTITLTACETAPISAEGNAPAGWSYNDYVGSKVPGSVATMLANAGLTEKASKSILEYDGTEAAGFRFTVSTPAELLYAAELSQSGVTFADQELRLTADIDLNPGWDATVSINEGVATLPCVPTVTFPGFATFAGTIDGNGHTISGVFMSEYFTANSSNLGFIEILGTNGSVRRVKFNNSFLFADMQNEDSVSDCKIGGIAARINGAGCRIESVYADINVWYRSYSMQRIGGIAGKVSGNNVTINNVIFAGTVGDMNPDNSVPGNSGSVYMSQLVADGNWKTTLVLSNYAMNGTCYAADGVTTTNAVASNDSASKTPGTPTVTAPSVSPVAAFALWPAAGTADRNTASYNDGLRQIRYYEAMTSDQFNTWTSSLAAGYTPVQSYSLDGGSNNSVLYQNGVYSVYASFLGAVGSTARARIVVEPYGANYQTVKTFADSARVCEAQIWQLDVDNYYNNADGGMSYVIRLTNGEFIVIDGGYQSENEANNLYSILAANNVLSGKPVIAGWFITHLHDDHFGGMTRFARLYNENVIVKGFYVNFPSNTVGNIAASDAIYRVADHMARFAGAKIYTIHSGMTIGFADAQATILATNEDVKQSYWDGASLTANDFCDANDTSTVVRFDVKNKAGNDTTKFMVLGDAGEGVGKVLRYTWTAAELGANIVQVAHHGMNSNQGQNGSTKDVDVALYQTIGASTYLWPAEIVTYENHVARDLDADNSFHNLYNSHSRDVNVWIKANAAEVIPAWENVCLTLPYVAGTYLDSTGIRSGNTVNTATAYSRKLLMTSNFATIDKCAAQQTTPAEGTTKIRFLATVTLDSVDVSKLGSFGFDITMIYNGNVYRWTKEINTIYTSVIAAGETITATEINAGSNYIFAYVLNGVPAGSGETVEFKVSCFGTLTTGEKIASNAYGTFTVTDGVLPLPEN